MKYRIALLIGLVFAIGLYLTSNSCLIVPVPEYLVYPALSGMIVHVLVTGIHIEAPFGGQGSAQDRLVGFVLEVPTNALFYSALLWGLSKLARKLQRPTESQTN